MTNGYYHYPAINQDTVVFVCEDDLWTVPAGGGVARRLTTNLGISSHPALSPDGQRLAFIGREEGEAEVYVMPAKGGDTKRLTYLGSNTAVLDWTPDGKIVIASDAGQPFARLTPLYTLDPEGGQPEPLSYGPARSISFGPEGGVVIGRRAEDLARWKRYRGGTAGDLWIDIKGNGKFKSLLKLKSNLASPMWIAERIYFLSDHEGIGNIYSCDTKGKDIQRHTHHEDFYVRQPDTDGRRIVYRAGADLYIFDPDKKNKSAVQKIAIEYYSPRVQRSRKFVSPDSYMESITLHPAGHSVAMAVRGKVFSMANWDGAVFQYGQRQGVRYRLAEWLNDGKRLIMVSDATGEETLEIHTDSSLPATEHTVERLEGLDIGRAVALTVSPREDAVVIANHRLELVYVDLKQKSTRLLDKSNYGRIAGIDWSPDGQWVAYGFRTSHHTCAIKLCRVETGETHFVTRPHDFLDFGPSFDPGGKYLYFISYREFDPVYDRLYFDLNFPRGSRPYLVTLQEDLPNPFMIMPPNANNGSKPDEKSKNGEDKNGEAEKTEAEAAADKKPKNGEKTIRIDFEGITQRVSAFPVSEGRYSQVRGVKDKVYFTSFPIEGSLGRSWRNSGKEAGKGALEWYDFVEHKKEFVVSGLNGFDVNRKRDYLIYLSGKNIRVLKAGEKPDNNASGYNKKSGWIKLSRLSVEINPPQEWIQMFREAWRLQRDHFWSEDMSSVDWQSVYQRYYPLVERVSTRAEFSDLVWEMQGELGTSHAYEIGGDYRRPPRYTQGFLGADFEYDAKVDGYRFTHIVQGDTWIWRSDSPLNRLGVNVKPGDILLAIDGQRLSREVSPQQILVNRAHDEVQLTVLPSNGDKAPANGTGPARTVLVRTLSSETPARYREWVETNRQHVHQATDGRVGYVHIPNMGPVGYAEFHRYYLSEAERQGLIVDVRFNGGGHVSQLLIEKLARRRLGYDQPRYGAASSYPRHAVLGPMVALANEFAGSDGDIFSHVFKLMKLGPLIGKRTWGGVIGISPRHSLADGTITTQPEFSFWFEDVGWGVENYGTNPDIEVDIKPQDYARDKDTQLDRALKEITKLLEDNPPQVPDFGPRPRLGLPKLPKTKG
ncbi:MAG: PDZ domain-containing protein [Anaerolineae bacterium]|nr:PDZ domain-containing protein [Anaerolineae bacterium]